MTYDGTVTEVYLSQEFRAAVQKEIDTQVEQRFQNMLTGADYDDTFERIRESEMKRLDGYFERFPKEGDVLYLRLFTDIESDHQRRFNLEQVVDDRIKEAVEEACYYDRKYWSFVASRFEAMAKRIRDTMASLPEEDE